MTTSIKSPTEKQCLEIPPVTSVMFPAQDEPWHYQSIDHETELSTFLPRGKIYPLSIPEQAAMEEYIKRALKKGCVRPSTSPAASSFFVTK